MYLDITYLNGEICILDENELLDAYRVGDVTQNDLDLVYKIRDKLLEEIKTGTNKVMNIDYKKYLNDF